MIRSLLSWFCGMVMTVVLGTIAPIMYFVPPRGRWWFGCAWLWSRSMLVPAGIRVEVSGPPIEPPFVYICNHESALDIPVLLGHLPQLPRFLAKKVLFSVPFIGWNMHLAGFVRVDRTNRRAATRAIDQAAREMATGRPVLVFAEETRSPDGILLPFQRGGFGLAMKAGIPIVPMGIDGARGLLRKSGFLVRPGTVRVRWGEPIPTAGLSRSDRVALIEQVRAEVQRLRGGGPMAAKSVATEAGKVELAALEPDGIIDDLSTGSGSGVDVG